MNKTTYSGSAEEIVAQLAARDFETTDPVAWMDRVATRLRDTEGIVLIGTHDPEDFLYALERYGKVDIL